MKLIITRRMTSQISNEVNLLPPEEKRILAKEKIFKLVLILAALILFILASFSLMLLSINFYISGQTKTQEILVDLEEESQDSEAGDLAEEINRINNNLVQLNSFYRNQPRFYEVFNQISKVLPDQIYLTNASVVLKAEEENEILNCSLTGYSPNRETLFSLKKNLEDNGVFKEIDFPPSNWVKAKDINFSVSFKIEP